MKKNIVKVLIWIVPLIFILLMACNKQEEGICLTFTPKPSDQYIFPLRPGMLGWEKLNSGQEMIDTLQIPEDKLETISTYGLVETCLDYPLLGNMLAFENIQKGTESQMNNFNGFIALESRDEAARIMLDRFKLMNPSCPPNNTNIADYSLFFIYMGMIQAQKIFIEQLAPSERKDLLNEAIKKYIEFEKIGAPYSIFNKKVEALIMARVMVVENFLPFLEEINSNEFIKIFIKDVELNNNIETLDIILDYAHQF